MSSRAPKVCSVRIQRSTWLEPVVQFLGIGPDVGGHFRVGQTVAGSGLGAGGRPRRF